MNNNVMYKQITYCHLIFIFIFLLALSFTSDAPVYARLACNADDFFAVNPTLAYNTGTGLAFCLGPEPFADVYPSNWTIELVSGNVKPSRTSGTTQHYSVST